MSWFHRTGNEPVVADIPLLAKLGATPADRIADVVEPAGVAAQPVAGRIIV
jgi:hypothetical protein